MSDHSNLHETIPNVLANRYASTEMKHIWSSEGKVRLERALWIAVMKAQRGLGIDIPEAAITAYEAALPTVNLHAIADRERVLKHDVKARIEEFNSLAGYEHIHKGMTSRDLTENVEQLQIIKSLKIVRAKLLSVLGTLSKQATQYKNLPLASRTHNVVAQPTTVGRRITMYGEEMLWAFDRLSHLIDHYPCRGIKGAVGTQQDQLTLLDNDTAKVEELEQQLISFLGFSQSLSNVGQVYPRSLDLDVISTLVLVGSGPSNFATTLRLMAGHELASEGFSTGQVGSSAMPHKMNSRSAERLNGFHHILKGHLVMATNLAGDQWNEGDVSCSVVRRVLLPDAFFTIDALLDTTLVVLGQMSYFETVITHELGRYAPFLATTTLLMSAIQHGATREDAHQTIKQHAIASILALRTGEESTNTLAQRLAEDQKFPLQLEEIQKIIAECNALTGTASRQVDSFAEKIATLKSANPDIQVYLSENIDLL
jgi:adenylosuccinate lyase